MLFPVQAKLPKLLHICLREHYNKIFKVKSFTRSSEVTELVLSLVLGYLCCSVVVAALGSVHTLAGVRRAGLSVRALQSLCWSG